ncbi:MULTISPECIES: M23 family metallopeptidase [unclassified Microcoleus]|uniref:M23 family metallopeptidase n=1 Tax=unclassified Microcoleus TaxID=2642155 RepID=UPI002FD529FE
MKKNVQDSTSPLAAKRLIRPKSMLLVAASIGLGLLGMGWRQDLVGAQQTSAGQVATGNLWQEASFPVENFEAYSSAFGPRGGDFHYGLDLAAPEGSYIRNWWGGQIVEVWEDGRCGTGMVVRSGDWEHIYCHLRGRVETSNGGRYYIDREGGLQIWQGQTVPAGARIARVGMTGRTTGPHLHWGLKYGGRWVDPALVLREMYSQQS